MREMASIGWHGYDTKKGFSMGRYNASIIPLKGRLLDKNSFIYSTANSKNTIIFYNKGSKSKINQLI